MRAFETAAVLRQNLYRPCLTADFSGQRTFGNLDAFGAQIVEHDASQFRIVPAQRFFAFDHCDLAAEPLMRLRQFHTDRPTTDDQQMFGFLAQVKNRFVGVIGHRVKPRNRRHQRRRSGCNHKPPRGDDVVASLHFFW